MPVNPVYNAIGWISEQIMERKMRKEMTEVKNEHEILRITGTNK
jgi:archaellum component FlaD/FlaE